MLVIFSCNLDGVLKYIDWFYVMYLPLKHLILTPSLLISVVDVTSCWILFWHISSTLYIELPWEKNIEYMEHLELKIAIMT